jgi:pimeloyl-ACP methyl ester carboxylesterase
MSSTKTILFLHGFASSARTTKAQYLQKKLEPLPRVAFHALDMNPTPIDFEYMTTTGLINRVRQYILDHELAPLSIVGSSFGGLVAIHYAHRFAGVEKLLHYAFDESLPLRYALHTDGLNFMEPVPPAVPTLIIHGSRDTSVPIEDSRAFAAEHPRKVQLIEVDADHDLNGHLPLIWRHLQSFLLDPQEGGG